MKNTLRSSLAFMSLIICSGLSGCIPGVTFEPVSGNGKTVDQERTVSDFHAIDVSGGLDVLLVPSDKESLVITADENLQQYIITEVTSGKLRIYTNKNFMNHGELRATIAFKSLNRLAVSGGGDVSARDVIKGSDLEISLSGGGDMNLAFDLAELTCGVSGGGDATLDGTARRFHISMSGGGDVKSNLGFKSIDCALSGGGDASIKSTEQSDEAHFDLSGGGDLNLELNTGSLKCTVSGGGNADVRGRADEFVININGGGNLNAEGLNTEITHFSASGGSNLHVTAEDELTGSISGGGDVYYSGNPAHVDIKTSGGSEAKKQ